jgi:hypothetical protein
MADISILSRLVNGIQRNVDLSANTLVLSSLKLGTSELTKAKLDLLVLTTDSPSAVDASAQHHHDGRYFTESELGSTADGSAGASLIGIDQTPAFSNFTPSAATVQGALEGIDTALATAGGSEFADNVFRINDDATPSKQIAFQASGISAATIRTITMPDTDVDLGQIATNTSNISTNATNLSDHEAEATGAHAASAISNTPAGNIAATDVQAALNELDNEKLALAGGTMSGAIAMGSNKITGLADGTAASDAINKGQLDSAVAGLAWKDPARVASTANINLASATDPNPIDGVTLANGDRILLKNQSAGAENGIYDAVTATDPTTWVRVSDMDTAAETSGAAVWVLEGTVNGDKAYTQTADSVTLGVTALTFVEFFGGAALSGGDGIDISSSVISVDLLASGGLKFSTGELGVEPADFAGTGLEDDGADNLRLAAQGNGIAGGAGSTLSVDPATEVAGSRAAVYVGADGVGIELDNSTLTHSSSTLGVKAGGIGETELNNVDGGVDAQSFVLPTGYTSGAGTVAAADTIDAAIRKLDGNNQSTQTDLDAVEDNGIASADGSVATSGTIGADNLDLSVNFAPKVQGGEVAGEAMPASGVRAVRYGVTDLDTPETAGRVYLADPTELSLVKSGGNKDPFHVVGLVIAASQAIAGAIDVVKHGPITATSHGFAIGEPVWLDSSGALTSTAPTTTGEAVVKVGVPKDANTIDVNIQIMGVN